MGKVGMVGGMPQMETTMVYREYSHFTQTISHHYSFAAKQHGFVVVSFSSQFYYNRNPNAMTVAIKKNGKSVAFNTNAGTTAPNTSAIIAKSPGDDITVDLEIRTSGTDVGCDYWISAMANEPIEFVET